MLQIILLSICFTFPYIYFANQLLNLHVDLTNSIIDLQKGWTANEQHNDV
jgi:hypothetical protein